MTRFAAIFTAILGVAVLMYGFRLGITDSGLPDAGLWPAVIGTGLLVCGVAMPKVDMGMPMSRSGMGVLIASVIWIALAETAGWQLASLAAIAVLRLSGGGSRRGLMLYALIAVAAIWLVFGCFLRAPLPDGAAVGILRGLI